MSRRGAHWAAIPILLLICTTPCLADITFCNKSDAPIDTALGFVDGQRGWTSRGWWVINAGECRTVWNGEAPNPYYAFANNQRGQTWSAPKDQTGGWFCISRQAFTIRNNDYEDSARSIHCDKGKLTSKQFAIHEVRPGANVTNNFVPPAGAPSGQPQVPPKTAVVATGPIVPSLPPTGAATACQRFPNLC